MYSIHNQYEKNRILLNQYRWWKETNAPLPSFGEIFRVVLETKPHKYIFVDVSGERSEEYHIERTETNTRPFFLNLSTPLFLQSEMNLYNLEYVIDNVRRSEDFGGDNHVYLWYSSVEEFALLCCVIDLTELLAEEKAFFLIGEKGRDHYPYDFAGKCGINYNAMPARPLRLEEIDRLIVDCPTGAYSGNTLMAGILDAHPNLLTLQEFGGVGFTYLYEKYLKNRTIRQMKKELEDSLSSYVFKELSALFLRREAGHNLSRTPDWDGLWQRIDDRTEGRTTTLQDFVRAFYLSYDELLWPDRNERIIPAIRFTTHFLGPVIKKIEGKSLEEDFKYRRQIQITRNPPMRIATEQSGKIRTRNVRRYMKECLVTSFSKREGYQPSSDLYLSNRFLKSFERSDTEKIIRFEDLKLHPVESLQALCTFLDIPFSESMWHTTLNGVRSVYYSSGSNAEISDFNPRPATDYKLSVVAPEDHYRIEMMHQEEMAAFDYVSKYYDGKSYSDDEIIELYRKPFLLEKYYYTHEQRARLESDREKLIENVKYRLAHPVTQTEDGEQLYPVPALDPEEGAKLFNKYGGKAAPDGGGGCNAGEHPIWEDMEPVSGKELEELFSVIEQEVRDYKTEADTLIRAMTGYPRVFLYGAGTDGRLIAEELEEQLKDCEVCFLDKDKNKHGKEICCDLFCYPVERAYGIGKDGVILLTSSLYADDIERELTRPPLQTPERLQGVRILSRYCVIRAKIREKEMLLKNRETLLWTYDHLRDDRSRFGVYWNTVLAQNYRDQITKQLQIPRYIESRDPKENCFPYFDRMLVQEGRTVIASFFSGDMLKGTRPFWENSTQVDVWEVNRIYCEELKETYTTDPLHERLMFNNAVIGDRTQTIGLDLYDGAYGDYGYLDYITDETVEMKTLDDLYMIQKAAAKTEENRVQLIIYSMENGITAALDGMEQLVRHDRPVLMLQTGGHYTHQHAYWWNVMRKISNWGVDYEFFIRNIYRIGRFLCAVPK